VLTREGSWEKARIVVEDAFISSVDRHFPAGEVGAGATPKGGAGAFRACIEGADTIRIDASGKWVIPGLIDAHVHLLLSMDSPRDDSEEQRLLKAARNARRHLLAGITTVRDCGAMKKLNIEVARAVDAGVLPGPTIIACGDFIAMTGGHVHYWALEADGPDELRKAAREQIKAGARFIKLMASGGAADPSESPDAPQLDEEEMRAAVAEAKKRGLKTASHAHSEQSILASLRAGVDTIEHATHLSAVAVDALLEAGAWIIPTFAVYRTIAADPRLPLEQREIARRVYQAKAPLFLAAVRQGVKYGVGTDSGSYYPHGNLATEMECMVESGLTCREVLMAATLSNAEALGIAKTTGTLEPGKRADMVVLSQDPLSHIGAVRQVDMVIKGGDVVSGQMA
jgi:imidazolonepropionase-like amidohydrolase